MDNNKEQKFVSLYLANTVCSKGGCEAEFRVQGNFPEAYSVVFNKSIEDVRDLYGGRFDLKGMVVDGSLNTIYSSS